MKKNKLKAGFLVSLLIYFCSSIAFSAVPKDAPSPIGNFNGANNTIIAFYSSTSAIWKVLVPSRSPKCPNWFTVQISQTPDQSGNYPITFSGSSRGYTMSGTINADGSSLKITKASPRYFCLYGPTSAEGTYNLQ